MLLVQPPGVGRSAGPRSRLPAEAVPACELPEGEQVNENVDRNPLEAFARRVSGIAELEPDGSYKVRVTGEYLAQVRAFLAGMDAGRDDYKREHRDLLTEESDEVGA